MAPDCHSAGIASLGWPQQGFTLSWGSLPRQGVLGGDCKKAPKLIVTAAREAVFRTKQKPFLSVPQEIVERLRVLDLNQRKSLLASSLEVITPWALAGGWGFQKANSGVMSEHTAPVPEWEADLLWAGVCRVNQLALSSPRCLWDHNFL